MKESIFPPERAMTPDESFKLIGEMGTAMASALAKVQHEFLDAVSTAYTKQSSEAGVEGAA